MIHELIQRNFVTVITAVTFLFFAFSDRSTRRFHKTIFILDAFVVLILIVASSVNYCEAQNGSSSFARYLSYATIHTLRSPSIYAMIAITWEASLKKKMILFAPAVLNGFFMLSSYFTHMSFSIDSSGTVHQESFFIFSFIVSVAYLLKVIWVSLTKFKTGNPLEGTVVICTAVFALLGVALELVLDAHFILNGIIITSILFYYLFYRSQVYKCDALTGLLNRHSFYHDTQLISKKNATVVSVDLNSLKLINDTNGHEAGDKAIKVTGNLLKKYAPDSCSVYRMGGDEYALLCPKLGAVEVSDFMRKSFEAIKSSGYIIAWGLAEYSPGMDFEKVMALSDSRMYEHKKKIKESAS